jgi:hypothetical protein
VSKRQISRDGICKLTLRPGRFVDSHIIPAALTRLSRTGEKAIETGIGHGVKKRPHSWYDSVLVTREGEDILAEIDARGIELLRQYRLVWSGWNGVESIAREFEPGGASAQGWRHVQILPQQAEDLQLFFLSLLWRAAASTRPEFADVTLPPGVLEDLRLRILHRAPGPAQHYPIQLFQLTTKGFEHNRTPLLERKRMPLTDNTWGQEVSYARFYFEGLVAHVHLSAQVQFEATYLASCLGGGPENNTLVFGHRFEESRTWDNIKEMATNVHRELRTPPVRRTSVAEAASALFEVHT